MRINGVDLSFQSSFELVSLAAEFYKPLVSYGITGAGGTRIYSDGRRFTIGNDFEYLCFFRELVESVKDNRNKSFMCDYYTAEISFDHLELITFDSLAPVWQMSYLREELHIASAILLILKYKNYTDLCGFYSSAHNPFAYNFYMNNRDLLIWFSRRHSNFLDNLVGEKSVLTYSVQNIKEYRLLSKITQYDKKFSTEIQKISFIDTDEIKKLSINNRSEISMITKREWQCLQWLAFGKSAEEIGLLLGISRRTVEHYIALLKKKFNCYKLNRLIYLAGKQGLLL